MSGRQTTTVLDLLRHGQPQGGERFRGSTDDPLSPQGWEAMRRAVGGFDGWHHLYCSPLTRCADFAHELHRNTGIPLAVHENLREIGFGEWEGRAAEDVLANEQPALRRYWNEDDPFTPPGAEAVLPFIARVKQSIEHVVARHQGRHLLIVSHGGTMRAALSTLLGLPFSNTMRIEIPYACLSRIAVYCDDHGAIQGCALQGHALRLHHPGD